MLLTVRTVILHPKIQEDEAKGIGWHAMAYLDVCKPNVSTGLECKIVSDYSTNDISDLIGHLKQHFPFRHDSRMLLVWLLMCSW